jgi:tRNA (guanine10-N2)-dimethyltransferase
MVTGNKLKLLFELSGEHPKLPFAELESVISVLQKDNKVKSSILSKLTDRLATVDITSQDREIIKTLSSRLAMSRRISEILAFGNEEQLSKTLESLTTASLPDGATFKLITHRIQRSLTWPDSVIIPLKKRIVQVFSNFASVDVKTPGFEIILYLDSELYLVKKLYDIPRSDFETRKPQNRPYFAPISLHPRLARCLVNLAELQNDQTLLDPFCGTGGILLEAGLMGFSVLGSDSDPNMVAGTIQNLNHWSISNCRIINTSIDELAKRLLESDTALSASTSDQIKVSAIVTEPPYGRASAIGGESLSSLIKRSFSVFAEILPRNGRVVISLPDPKFAEYAKGNFKLLNEFNFRVHKSLIKSIYVFELKKLIV